MLLLVNKRNGGCFTAEEERFAGTIALTIRQHNTATRQQTANQFDHLLEQALISGAELEHAMAEARRRNCDTESVLLDTYQVPKAAIGRALSLHYGRPFVAYDERMALDAGLLRGLNVDYLRMNHWMPLRRSGDRIEVLVDNPQDAAKIEHIRALPPGASLRWLVGLRQDIARFLQRASSQQGEFGGIEAALTGHLVFSTLHTNSTPKTVTRLLDIRLDPFNCADALVAVLAQRLVRTLYPACKEAYQPDEGAWAPLRQAYGEAAFAALEVPEPAGVTLYRPRGCEVCQGLGCKGRVAVRELLVASDDIRQAIQPRARVTDVADLARRQGMTTLLQDGVLKVLGGLTDLTQVKAVAER